MEAVGDIEGQAARVLALLKDADLFASVAEAARNTALTRFCTDKIIPQYVQFYEELL
jgi:hypothetical protein